MGTAFRAAYGGKHGPKLFVANRPHFAQPLWELCACKLLEPLARDLQLELDQGLVLCGWVAGRSLSAVVLQKDWDIFWEAMQPIWGEMRTAFRAAYGGKHGPTDLSHEA